MLRERTNSKSGERVHAVSISAQHCAGSINDVRTSDGTSVVLHALTGHSSAVSSLEILRVIHERTSCGTICEIISVNARHQQNSEAMKRIARMSID